MSVEQKLKEMGITLPDPPAPAGSYVPVVKSGRLLFVSGQIPVRDGKLAYSGRVSESNMEQARESARLCAVNILAQVKKTVPLEDVSQVVRLSGFVNAEPGFTKHPLVINAASDLIYEVFGEKGRHARIAVGVSGLPLGAMTEIDAIVETV